MVKGSRGQLKIEDSLIGCRTKTRDIITFCRIDVHSVQYYNNIIQHYIAFIGIYCLMSTHCRCNGFIISYYGDQ